MTMSVGLGRIVVDPTASVLVRKALGVLSTPGMLVYDTGLTIDDTGRIVVRLKPDGGLVQDADGLYLETTVGIDSHVDLVSDEYDRDWNAYLSGTAPNFLEGRVLIGSELENNAPGITAAGQTLDTPMVNIWNSLTQLRLSFNEDNFTSFRTNSGGELEIFSIGLNPASAGVHIVTGDGVLHPDEAGNGGLTINNGDQIEIVQFVELQATFTGGGAVGTVSWEEQQFALTPVLYPEVQTVCFGGPRFITGTATNLMSWSVGLISDNVVALRISWYNTLTANSALYFVIGLIRFKAH